MMRWKAKLTSAALLAVLGGAGCKQQLYMHQDDHQGVLSLNLPRDLDTNPAHSIVASTRDDVKVPPTSQDPDQPPRYITLQEALIIGLEQGNRGNANAAGLSGLGSGAGRILANDDLVQSTGRGIGGDDAIRAFALDPAIVGADIEGALSKFDARWVTSMSWQKNDTAVANSLNNLNNGDTAAFSTGLIKPLATGGVAGITFNTDYTKLSSPPNGFQVLNPAYRPAATVAIEQPLLKDYGVDINQLTAAHPFPNSIQNYRAIGGRSEGILISRVRFEQSKFQFERDVNIMLLNIEYAYWNMYSAYYGLYASDQAVRQSHETWRLTKILVEAGTRADQELDQARARFEEFRGRRINALQVVLESERQMRALLGMPVVDGYRLVPADTPSQASFKPDYVGAVNEMLANRPELNIVRQELKARQLDLMVQKNNLRPDLRAFANYNVNGIGQRLDGGDIQANALNSFGQNKFNNWNIGLRYDVPIGFRDANSSLRVSQLNLARTYVTMKNQELKAERFLESVYQQIFNLYEQIKVQRERRIALGRQLELLFTRYQLGKDALIIILDAQRDFADAIRLEHEAIANYNIAVAGFQYAKGTLMNYDNVVIAEGPLPQCGLTPAHELGKRKRNRFEGAPVEAANPLQVNPIPQVAPPIAPMALPVAEAAPTLPTVPSVAVQQPAVEVPGVPAPVGENGRPVITVTTPGAATAMPDQSQGRVPAIPASNPR